MKVNHFVESQQLDAATIFSLFDKADEMRAGKRKLSEGKILATIFYEPSTRTRLSFESAMIRLGGNVITTENAKEFSSAMKGESLEDTVRIISSYADLIVLRHYEEGASKIAASVSGVPIINAGDGPGQHPTQALLDIYTIWKEIGRIDGITVAMVGDLRNGRTIRSLCYLLGKFSGVKIIFIAPLGLEIKEDIKEYLARHGVEYYEENDLNSNLPKADIVYATRIQKERIKDSDLFNTREGFKINETNLQLIRKDARLMHPLPHVDEISLPIEVEQKDARVAYFRQAENGLYIRMALLAHLLENPYEVPIIKPPQGASQKASEEQRVERETANLAA